MFATRGGRLAHVAELETRLCRWTSGRSAREAMYQLQRVGVPSGVVQNYLQVLEDPHLSSRNWFQEITHPDMGSHRYNGFPWRFSRTPAAVSKSPPRVGEDSEAVLRNDLGLSDEEIRQLFSQHVTAFVRARPGTTSPIQT